MVCVKQEHLLPDLLAGKITLQLWAVRSVDSLQLLAPSWSAITEGKLALVISFPGVVHIQ